MSIILDDRIFNSGVRKPKILKKSERFPLVVPYQFLAKLEEKLTGKRSDFFRMLLLKGAACQTLSGQPCFNSADERHYISIRVNPVDAELIRSQRLPDETIADLTRRLIYTGITNHDTK